MPPTGAKGLNHALEHLGEHPHVGEREVLERVVLGQDRSALDDYTPRALARVWKAQHFSCWMTTMLHRSDDASDVDEPGRGLHRLARRDLGSCALAGCARRPCCYAREALWARAWTRR